MNITLMFVHRLSYSVNTSNSEVYINKAADMSNVGGFMNLLSLFSGCGGMDIGFEGNFLCLKKSINTQIHPDWVESENGNWVKVKKTIFNTVVGAGAGAFATGVIWLMTQSIK